MDARKGVTVELVDLLRYRKDWLAVGVALTVPVLLVLIVRSAAGEGHALLERIRDVAVVGSPLWAVCRGLQWLYFPTFLAEGWVAPVWVLLALYLVFLFYFLARRKWGSAVIVVFVPLICTWAISATALAD